MIYVYRNIIQNEDICTNILKIRDLLPTDQTYIKIKNQAIWGGELKKVLKRVENVMIRNSEGKIDDFESNVLSMYKKGC